MAESGMKTSELASALPAYFRRHEKLNFEHGRLGALIQLLEGAYPSASADRSDGLKLTTSDGWIHVRASNTEPVLRLSVEARTQGALDEIHARARAFL